MNEKELLEEIPYAELKQAYHKLERRNKDLIDGLYYAAFVQQGLLPQSRHFRKSGLPYFIIYDPLQIIGGDFFWIGKKDDWLYYCVGDCTGHGVSGAMLSSLAIGFFNYVVYSKDLKTTGEVLDEIDKKWIETFNHYEDEQVNNDWMELSLIAFHPESGKLQFSGAGSSLMIANGQREFRRIRGDHFPIGGWQIESYRRFSTHEMDVHGTERIFLYSDGFKDQFGGHSNKRFGNRQFLQLLNETSNMDCLRQKTYIENVLLKWRGTNEQTDDICVLGVDLLFNI